jgi:hypothetical protein
MNPREFQFADLSLAAFGNCATLTTAGPMPGVWKR